MTPHQNSPNRARYRVYDREKLARLTGEVVRLIGKGETKTARILGISQPTLNRLKNAARPKGQRTFKRRVFDRYLGGVMRYSQKVDAATAARISTIVDGLYESIRPVDADSVSAMYQSWLIHYFHSFLVRNESRMQAAGSSREPVSDLVTIAYRKRWDVVAILDEAYRRCPQQIEDFHRAMMQIVEPVGSFGGTDRAVVAYLRLIEPLIHSADSGFVERHWTELGDDDQWREFIEAGIARELIVLKRDDDLQRVNAIATGDHVRIAERTPSAEQKRSLNRHTFFQRDVRSFVHKIATRAHRKAPAK